jgi:ATP-dependent DNA helicase RecG
MEKVHVGFELAEIDLKMRGAGEIFGLKQSGFVNLKIADLTDTVTLKKAQEEAEMIVKNNTLKNSPALLAKIESLQNEYIQPN